MPRINPTVSQEAFDIVQEVQKQHKGEWVSDAIIEKHNREQGKVFTQEQEQRIREIVKEERE